MGTSKLSRKPIKKILGFKVPVPLIASSYGNKACEIEPLTARRRSNIRSTSMSIRKLINFIQQEEHLEYPLYLCYIQNWIAYRTLPSGMQAEQQVINFENNTLPSEANNNAFCQVNNL